MVAWAAWLSAWWLWMEGGTMIGMGTTDIYGVRWVVVGWVRVRGQRSRWLLASADGRRGWACYGAYGFQMM